MNVVVLISGNGSNLQAIIDHFTHSAKVTICAVISNNPQAYGLQRAAAAGIAHECIDHHDYSSREAFDQALQTCIDSFQPELVVLAGFMRKLTDGFVAHYRGRMINIHPSLLPKYRGLNTHQRALAAGEKEHGISIHYVSEDLDGGPIIAQAKLTIQPNESEENLIHRIHQLEHIYYPHIIELIADQQVSLVDNTVHYRNKPLTPTGMMLN